MTRKRQRSVEERSRDGAPRISDLVTIQRAYAANVDALKVMEGVLATVTSEVGQLGSRPSGGQPIVVINSRDRVVVPGEIFDGTCLGLEDYHAVTGRGGQGWGQRGDRPSASG